MSREFRELGAATVHEAIGRRGALPSVIKPFGGERKLAAPVFTVSTSPHQNIAIHEALYEAPRGSALIVETGGGHEAGYWGDILNSAAIAAGIAGLIIDGCVRDVDRLASMPLPVFARGVCLRGTGKERVPAHLLGAPIRIGEVLVHSGDWAVCDADGVVIVPADEVDAALDAGRSREAKESAVLKELAAGHTTLDIYGF
jgi:4-hydroxy-4-methyl-2-oxoglutarate aldolase